MALGAEMRKGKTKLVLGGKREESFWCYFYAVYSLPSPVASVPFIIRSRLHDSTNMLDLR